MTAISETSFKLELGLHVARLGKAVDFYSTLFGTAPVRQLPDFARFEVDDPPVVLTLRSGLAAPGGALNHVGFRVEDSSRLVDVQHRLELAGIATQREEGVECCYSRQTKFWVPDADANLWEIYSLEEDLDHSGFGGAVPESAPPTDEPPVVWGHRSGEALTLPIPLNDAAADEIHLDETLNDHTPPMARAAILQEIVRVLRPGGSLAVRTAAAALESVPDICGWLLDAGLRGVQIEQLRPRAGEGTLPGWDLSVSAVKPAPSIVDPSTYEVMYLGPLAEVELDDGRRFHRCQRVAVDRSTWQLCQSAGFSAHFTCFQP
jgi:catechol 2,3-dioxygenase-like lactoylglutathione lyase family enzyme